MADTIIPTAGEKIAVEPSADTIRASGERVLSDAKAKVLDAAETQRRRAAEAVRGMAGALHRAAGDLKPENETMGRYTDMAAEQLDHFAGYLRGANWSEVVEEAEDMARRQPVWFIGGAMAAGFLLARTIKNAAPRRGEGSVGRAGRRLPAASAYGTGPEAGLFPADSASPQPIGSAPGGGPAGGEI